MENYIQTKPKISKTAPKFSHVEFAQYLQSIRISTTSQHKLKIKNLLPDGDLLGLNKYTFPDDWNIMKSHLNYKHGETCDPVNFRILSYPCDRIMELENSLYKFYSRLCKIDKSRQFFGQIHCAISSVHYLLQKKSGLTLFLDIKNAFGSINHELMTQMINNEYLRNYYTKFYTGAKIKLKIGDETQTHEWCNGLAQGSPLSILLFQIYMEYVIDALENLGCKVVAFVDDLVLHFENTPDEQKIIEVLEYFDFKCNFSKCRAYGLPSTLFPQMDTEFLYLGHNICYINEIYEDFKYKLRCAPSELLYLLKLIVQNKNHLRLLYMVDMLKFNKIRNKMSSRFGKIHLSFTFDRITDKRLINPTNDFLRSFDGDVKYRITNVMEYEMDLKLNLCKNVEDKKSENDSGDDNFDFDIALEDDGF